MRTTRFKKIGRVGLGSVRRLLIESRSLPFLLPVSIAMTLEQIKSKAADCHSTIHHAEFVAPGIPAQTVLIVGIGSKHVRIMFRDGSTQFVIPSRSMFFTVVW
jgi:hypothetical protein